MVHRFAAAIDAKRTRLRAIGERLRQLGHPHLATVLVDQSRNIVATAPTVFAYDCYRRRLNVAERAREIAAGHPFTVGNGVVYFSNEADQRLYRQGGDGQPRPITPLPTPGDGDAALRYADGVVDGGRGRLICVREAHVWLGESVFKIGLSTELVAEGTRRPLKEFTAACGPHPLQGVVMPDTENSFSRRQIVGSAGLGVAAMAGTVPAAAQGSTAAATAKPLEDPTKKYPRPPYNRQSQPWPGLASKMEPAPDHGEKSYRGSGRLAGRKALITGGDSGMGRAAAIAFAREGADVAINYLPSEEPDAGEVVQLIQAAGRKAVPIPGDLRDASFCRRLVEDAASQLGGLDILVSNAGRQQSRRSIAEVSDEDFDATMKTNIYAPFYIIKAALPHLQPGSAIIATASEQAYDPSPDLYDYAQTKAATMNFVKSLAKQLGPKGIRVNGVAPGPIWTPLQISGGASEGKVVTFGATAPLGRAGQPAELAGIYVRLAEGDGSYTTGNIYGAGGGQGQP